MLGPGAIGLHLADMGAEVIKIESPAGDYIRQMTWPIIEGTSLLHLHVNRGKKSLTLDLRKPEGVQIYLDLAKDADIVIEAMRPGSLAKRGLSYEKFREVNPRIVFCNISGYGMTGPYKDMPSHGIAYDTWAGLVNPAYDEEDFCYIAEHPSMGIHAGPLIGALGLVAAVLRARETGEGCMMKADNYVRRAPGTAGMKEGVRYQMYEASDGHVLFMASEQAFWKNFCAGVGRMELFEKWPGSKYADHARGNRELQHELREIFKTKTCAEWLEFSNTENTPIAPVNTPKTIANDPQFQHRLPWYPASKHGAEMLPFPVKFVGEELPAPAKAPTVGEHNEEVLREVLDYDADKIAKLREAGALG
jgi:crotonobetainyl-CoA:carnitine CoA-transferase CaiB-like acyl-CoA transferase